MYASKDPKYTMNEINMGGGSAQNRNYSGVLSQKTAASSNHIFQMTHQGGVHNQHQLAPQYSQAIMSGGGFGLYERLLHDSTENLLRPTAAMIGNANRISMRNYSNAAWATTAGKKRQLASANIQQRRNMRPPTNNDYTSNDVSSTNLGP
jgi:hypothetical protein